MHAIIICKNNTVFAKSDFWSKTRQPAPVSPMCLSELQCTHLLFIVLTIICQYCLGLYRVKCLLVVHERNTQWYVVFATLLSRLFYGMDVICCRVLAPKSYLLKYRHICFLPCFRDASFCFVLCAGPTAWLVLSQWLHLLLQCFNVNLIFSRFFPIFYYHTLKLNNIRL